MRRRITASLSFRKHVGRIFGMNVTETVRVPMNPLVMIGTMLLENLWHKPVRKVTRRRGGE